MRPWTSSPKARPSSTSAAFSSPRSPAPAGRADDPSRTAREGPHRLPHNGRGPENPAPVRDVAPHTPASPTQPRQGDHALPAPGRTTTPADGRPSPGPARGTEPDRCHPPPGRPRTLDDQRRRPPPPGGRPLPTLDLPQKIARDLSFPAVRWNSPTQGMDDKAPWDTTRPLLHDDTIHARRPPRRLAVASPRPVAHHSPRPHPRHRHHRHRHMAASRRRKPGHPRNSHQSTNHPPPPKRRRTRPPTTRAPGLCPGNTKTRNT